MVRTFLASCNRLTDNLEDLPETVLDTSNPYVFFNMIDVGGGWTPEGKRAAFRSFLEEMGSFDFNGKDRRHAYTALLALGQYRRMNYTNALPAIRRLALNPTFPSERSWRWDAIEMVIEQIEKAFSAGRADGFTGMPKGTAKPTRAEGMSTERFRAIESVYDEGYEVGRAEREQQQQSVVIARRVLAKERDRTLDVQLKKSIIMPEHVHLRLYLRPGQEKPLEKMGRFVYNFKAWTRNHAKKAGVEIRWQKNYHDWILPSREIIVLADKYIQNNPLKWSLMHGNPPPLKVVELLCSAVIPASEWWSGVGRIDWLGDSAVKMAAVRLSRSIPVCEMKAVCDRLLKAAEKGYVPSGWFLCAAPAVRSFFVGQAVGDLI